MNVTAKTLAAGLILAGLSACTVPEMPKETGASYFLPASSRSGRVQCEKTPDEMNAHAAMMSNSKRRLVGLHPVQADSKLAKVAAQIACDLAKKGVSSQSGVSFGTAAARAKKQGYNARILAKNVSSGDHDLHSILKQWNNSRVNSERILTPRLRDAGIGTALAADGKTRVWTAVYAAE